MSATLNDVAPPNPYSIMSSTNAAGMAAAVDVARNTQSDAGAAEPEAGASHTAEESLRSTTT